MWAGRFAHPWSRTLAASGILLLIAFLQIYIAPQGDADSGGWFLFGTDTVSHDAIVHLWVQQQMEADPTTIPLWIAPIQGGIPALGAFAWTPFSISTLPLYIMSYPAAQKLGWLLNLWIAGLGGYCLARAARLRWIAAVYTAIAWMLCGHLVTLIHAGHLQKVSALAWMGWAVAGAVIAAHPKPGKAASGSALAGGAVGMQLLSGHPQIAYATLGVCCLYILWMLAIRPKCRRRPIAPVLAILAIPILALMVGGAQMLPGLEMAPLSNRADGVTFEEAVETSYPPGEIPEFVIPRYKGSSVRGDVYTGEWGERIVSDYIGPLPVLLAVLALFLAKRRRGIAAFWLIVGALALVVGLGKHTPLYQILYAMSPGFRSFRSPGTFMCITSLAIAFLSGISIDALLTRRNHKPIFVAACLLCVYTSLNLARTNRHFLLKESWDRYSAYLQPNDLDLELSDRQIAWITHDMVNELSLRPILLGGRSINGYHPVYIREKDRVPQSDLSQWLQHWGISHVILFNAIEVEPPARIVKSFPQLNRELVDIGVTDLPSQTVRHLSANAQVITTETAPIVVHQVLAPGHIVETSADTLYIQEPISGLSVDAAEATVRYRPNSWRIGLFLTALGAMITSLIAGFHFTAKRRRR